MLKEGLDECPRVKKGRTAWEPGSFAEQRLLIKGLCIMSVATTIWPGANHNTPSVSDPAVKLESPAGSGMHLYGI